MRYHGPQTSFPHGVLSRLGQELVTVLRLRDVRETLAIKPGDMLRYRITARGVIIDKAAGEDDPFATFSEWSGARDEAAYRDL